MSRVLPISCYIRTKNEADRIVRTVEAALKLCDEVLVVDSESTDATVELARQAGARVINQAWLGNGGQKRVGEEACEHDWLLDIDADEIVSDELAADIRAVFTDGEPRESAFEFRIVTKPPLGKTWTNCCVVHRVKLYDRRQHRIPDHAAWDQFKVEDTSCVGCLKGALLHYSFRNITDMMAKMNRVSSIRANEKKLKPKAVVIIRIFCCLPWYFLRNYIKRGMWKRGVYGFSCALVAALGRWLTDVKMYEIHRGLKVD